MTADTKVDDVGALIERLHKEASFWAGSNHTISGPQVEKLLREAAAALDSLIQDRRALNQLMPMHKNVCANNLALERRVAELTAQLATEQRRVDELQRRVDFLIRENDGARADERELALKAERNENIQRNLGHHDSANAWKFFADNLRALPAERVK
jgi:predicted RNase H-like nuclease (RuvC/YqgF family)